MRKFTTFLILIIILHVWKLGVKKGGGECISYCSVYVSHLSRHFISGESIEMVYVKLDKFCMFMFAVPTEMAVPPKPSMQSVTIVPLSLWWPVTLQAMYSEGMLVYRGQAQMHTQLIQMHSYSH